MNAENREGGPQMAPVIVWESPACGIAAESRRALAWTPASVTAQGAHSLQG